MTTEFGAKGVNLDGDFLKWLKNNPEGFFLNDKGINGFMLHKSTCGHMKFTQKVNLTSNRKICSLDRKELENYVKNNGSKILKICRSCAP